MTFEEVLDQALALPQRRGRVTYRTLKRQFQLDRAGERQQRPESTSPRASACASRWVWPEVSPCSFRRAVLSTMQRETSAAVRSLSDESTRSMASCA